MGARPQGKGSSRNIFSSSQPKAEQEKAACWPCIVNIFANFYFHTSTPSLLSTTISFPKGHRHSLLPPDIQTTSSLPSSPPPAATAEDGPGKIDSQRAEQPGSPAFSTTSTADEGGSSPILPPLPAPTFNGRTLDLLKTPPPVSGSRSVQSDNSHYYTASWGSPYQEPAAGTTQQRSHSHSLTLSSEPSEDSPIRHLEFHTPYLRPAPNFVPALSDLDFVSNDGLISAAVLANRARRPPTGLTEDWIRQHTGGESAERNHWLSDDEHGGSGHSSLSGSISGDSRHWAERDTDPRTPTLKRFLDSRQNSRPTHRRGPSTETLKQADFSSSFGGLNMAAVNEHEPEVEMGEAQSSHVKDQPPTPPPKELPTWRAAALPAAAAAPAPAPVPSPAPGPPRLKKKIPWKGKSILVQLPWDDERGQLGKAPTPMSQKDVDAMVREWEQLGYDTTGFNLGPNSPDAEEGGQGQSRGIWPYDQDMLNERAQRSFRVSIPDRREWDAYVEELREAKINALLNSLGNEDAAPTTSPVVSNISRRTSMQYPPLPFSPPLPTSSAASSHITHNPNPFSPALLPGAGLSTGQSSQPGSVASPASMHAQMHGKYNPRASVSFSGSEHPFGSPFQYPQQQSPTVWSPQQMLYQQGAVRGGSPSLQNLGAIASPSSPFSQDGYFPQNSDVMSQLQHRQQVLQSQLAHQQQLQFQAGARASPRLQEVREIEDEDAPSKSPSKTPEARQIRHNPSASLQKEIDDAEYHLEEQFQRQLEHEDYSPHSDKEGDHFEEEPAAGHVQNASSIPKGLGASRYATDDSEEGPVLHHPQPHSRGHSLSQRPFHDSEESAPESKSGLLGIDVAKAEVSDIETNPSNLGTPVQISDLSASHERSLSVESNPWADPIVNHTKDSAASRRGHGLKPSISSKLNVAAKEFKFDPTSAFMPSQFSSSGNFFQPPIGAYSAFAPPVPVSATSSHFSGNSMSSSKGRINVAAPAFTPGQSEFSFSTSGPSFRPDAPAFTPLNTSFNASVGSATSESEGLWTSIFGNIDLSQIGISRPGKKSKAIPIVRPDSSHSKNLDEDVEDKDGRITQGAGRIKRARGEKDDGDSVPLFAEPSMPLGETTREQSPPKENLTVTTSPADKENSAPLSGGEEAPSIPTKSHARSFSQESPEAPHNNWAPWEFKQEKQAEEFSTAMPFTSRRYGSGLPAYGFPTQSSDEKASPVQGEAPRPHGHKKNMSSLSATAKPFEFKPNAFSFTFGEPSESKPAPAAPPSLPTSGGLAASRFARSPTPPAEVEIPEVSLQPHESVQFQTALPGPQSPPKYDEFDILPSAASPIADPSEVPYEDIDDVMQHIDAADRAYVPGTPRLHQPSPAKSFHIPDVELDTSSPIRLQPQNLMRSDAPSPSPRRYNGLSGDSRMYMGAHEDPFVNEPTLQSFESPIHNLNTIDSQPPSEWDDVLSQTEEDKLHPRAQFFDNHVNVLVGGLLSKRIEPLERTLEAIQMSLEMMAARAPSSRRERRSISGALSDADDEDDDNDVPRRSLSPRRDKKMEKIRAIITEALSAHQLSRPSTAKELPPPPPSSDLPDSRTVLQTLEEMKEQFGQSMRLDLRGEDLRNIVEEAVERRMPASPKPVIDEPALAREAEQRARISELEERLISAAASKAIVDEAAVAREAEQKARISELEERLISAASMADEAAVARESEQKARISELEERLISATSMVDEAAAAREAEQKARIAELEERLLRADADNTVRIADLEEKLARAETKTEDETNSRRAAEDRLAEVQRLLRISSEEETRLREAMDEREVKIREIVDQSDHKVRTIEEQRAKTSMRIALLEAAQGNAQRSQSELQSRVAITEADLRESRQEVQRWQIEAERALEAAKRHSEDAEQANETNKDLRRTIESLRTQIEESIRVREGMRGKLMALQEDMARAARDISEENARRAKREQELIARQEVLDAKLQAEARTRERLETEIERLEAGEREGMRAVSDCKKLEALVSELKLESHNAQKDAMRYQREFEEARESGLSEVQRTRHYMQAEIEAANNQVNVVREDLENQLSRLRAEIDHVKLDADTARAKTEMLLEEAETSKLAVLNDLKNKHADEIEDIQAQHERQLTNAIEDAQRSEQHLLERLSLSSAKTEHLQDRVSHLEEKLEIANQAANAAAVAAKTARSASLSQPAHAPGSKAISRAMDLPEKISPQALRESIMVLQEQLQERESTIESLEATISTLDVDSPMKIQKRDDEISWLRELLAVRKGDLQDIVESLEGEDYDMERVKDAAIRLRASLQMEEQERERAMNGGSALSMARLPDIAASLRDAASPRVAQAVGPLAAAWGNWRKGRSESRLDERLAGSSSSTPSRNSPSTQSLLGGLLTPPASNARQGTPPAQPTAFGSTGQRFTARELATRPRTTPKAPTGLRGSPAKGRQGLSGGGGGGNGRGPSTPPMLRKGSYDADARAEDFSDAGFYDDDESLSGEFPGRR